VGKSPGFAQPGVAFGNQVEVAGHVPAHSHKSLSLNEQRGVLGQNMASGSAAGLRASGALSREHRGNTGGFGDSRFHLNQCLIAGGFP
jgi:hypothetical protein